MSNKVFFNLDDLFISVGIDVGADFSWMSIIPWGIISRKNGSEQ